MVHQVFNDAFEALLAGWHRYMALAATTDDSDKLAELQEEVVELRQRADRLQRALSPDDGEREEGELAAYCPFIRTTVYIPSNEVRYTRDDLLTFECRCEREVGHRPTAWRHDTKELGAKGGDYVSEREKSREPDRA